MKNILDNTIFRLAFFSSIYIIILILLSPFIDHLFTPLEEYEKQKNKNLKILGEIILHIIVLAISWYYLKFYLKKILEWLIGSKIKIQTSTAIDIIASIALIGLQNNLITKIKYITFEHPFRMSDFQIF
tara:strand:+ start:1070 stop:1456 length:387 start_codon:yes stop_codon:yes gene_type:complete